MTMQNQPPVLDNLVYIPPLRVPATFGTYQGPTRNPIGTPAIPGKGIGPIVRALPTGERRNALVRQAQDAARIAVNRASHNARLIAGKVPLPKR